MSESRFWVAMTQATRSARVRTTLVVALVVFPLGVATVIACGPFYPEPLLAYRVETLKRLPAFSFSREVASLFPTIPAPQSRKLVPKDESKSEALYTQGADAYGNPTSADRGLSAFKAVLALPDDESAHRKIAAAFMVGKAHAEIAFLPGHDPDHEIADAISAFVHTRALVAAGWPDPDELGLSSWGEEARLHLRVDARFCGWKELSTHAACADKLSPPSLESALHLYARQAAAGSYGGEDSLRFLLGWVSGRESLITSLTDDPLSRKLLTLYVLAYDYESELEQTSLKALAIAAHRQGWDPGDKSELLALAAYRVGRFDEARDFAAGNFTPLASWVRAKLAVVANDPNGAAQAYAEAVKGFPVIAAGITPQIATRIKGEQGILALSRGEFVQAFSYLFAAAEKDGVDGGISNDAAYVAERVLTTDELKAYVDRNIPVSPESPGRFVNGKDTWMGNRIRVLLAKRLVRERRLEEALTYFPEADEVQSDPWEKGHLVAPFTLRRVVRAYSEILSETKSPRTVSSRAEAWFAAALLIKDWGDEIMSREAPPDYTLDDGNASSNGFDDVALKAPPPAERKADRVPVGSSFTVDFIQPQELTRVRQSAIRPAEWHHYRWVAVDYATKAADLLPPRSQAYAAVLCQAAGWETDRTQELYKRYVAHGALVPFAPRFGHQCDVTPKFAEARFFTLRHYWSRIKNKILRHL